MGLFRLLMILVILLLVCHEILSKSKGSRVGDSFGRSKPKHRYSGRTNLFSRRSGLSNSRKQALFFATGALTGIYIASHIKPRIKSYRDLYSYVVCHGNRYVPNGSGITQKFSYFVCPDDPNQPFEDSCCLDSTTGVGACCSDDVKMYSTSDRGAVVGTLLGIMLLIITLGSIVYCCFRCKRQREGSPVDVPNAQFTSPLDPVYKPEQYPRMDPSSSIPSAYPSYSYPSNGQYVSYPQNGDVPYPTVQPTMPAVRTEEIGSGWGASNNTPISTIRPDFPPPPYPGSVTSNVDTVNPSAPSSAWMTKS